MKRNPDDLLYERQEILKVFVSSQMRGNVLRKERQTADNAIVDTGFASSWLWENNAAAGPYSSEEICLGHARTSDGLVLLLSNHLTPITKKEYEAAESAGVPRYIFLKQKARRDSDAKTFISNVRASGTTTGKYGNLSELETQIKSALIRYAVDSVRRRIVQTKGTKKSTIQKALSRIKRITGASRIK